MGRKRGLALSCKPFGVVTTPHFKIQVQLHAVISVSSWAMIMIPNLSQKGKKRVRDLYWDWKRWQGRRRTSIIIRGEFYVRGHELSLVADAYLTTEGK